MAWEIIQSVTVEAMTVGWSSPRMSIGCAMSKWVSAPAFSRALRAPLSTAEASPHMTSTLLELIHCSVSWVPREASVKPASKLYWPLTSGFTFWAAARKAEYLLRVEGSFMPPMKPMELVWVMLPAMTPAREPSCLKLGRTASTLSVFS